MKFFVLIIAVFTILVACRGGDANTGAANPATDSANYTTIQWIDSVKDIGTVAAGTKTEIKFRFKNTGNKPLFIINAQPGCGCTIADYPKEAIAPGTGGTITANYDIHKGTSGEFRKNIFVTTNTKPSGNHNIFFYGQIKKEDNSATSSPDSGDTGNTQKVKNIISKTTKNS